MTSSDPLFPTHTETVIDEIRRERVRQETQEGFGEKHDDQYQDGVLSRGAACYALGYASWCGDTTAPDGSKVPYIHIIWPWPAHWWKPKTTRRNLIRAAALLVAEIERLDRANPSTTWHGDTP